MNRRDFFKTNIATYLASTALLFTDLNELFAAEKKAMKSPNIILILTDDQGWSDLSKPMDPNIKESCYSIFNTPRMNKILSKGMRFTDAYASAPTCTPARRSIQFGMTPARQFGTEFQGQFDPVGKQAIPEALKSINSAYKCAHIGKWSSVHTGRYGDSASQAPGSPKPYGYDVADGRTNNASGGMYSGDELDKNYVCEAVDDPKLSYSLTDRSIAFMKEQVEKGNPFYLQISYYAIHTAFQAKAETMKKYEGKKPTRQIAEGLPPMLEDMDICIGKFMDEFKSLGIDDNTYIFFTSDNGGEHHYRIFPKDSELPPRNYPLRLQKQWLYEGGIRVPFAVLGPEIKGETICREPVVGYDLLPTFYDLAGGKKPLTQEIDGGSLREVLFNEGKGKIKRPLDGIIFHRPFFQDRKAGHSAYREENYKLVLHWTPEGKVKSRELYDLEVDLGEQNDISKIFTTKAEQLQKTLLDYINDVDPLENYN